jgi:acetyltransferase-like isoleucine patch superfamily enzyme
MYFITAKFPVTLYRFFMDLPTPQENRVPQKNNSKIKKLIRRFLVPQVVTCAYYFFRYRARISPRAEVELSPNLTMGRDCTISSFSKFKASDGPLTLGQRCGFATGCFISTGQKGIIIGDNLVCGPNVVITASNYIHDRLGVHLEDQGHTSKGVRIGNNVWIGANAVILDGSVLGDNTIVVANSLVNRRYPANTIIQGSPAKIILKRAKTDESVELDRAEY